MRLRNFLFLCSLFLILQACSVQVGTAAPVSPAVTRSAAVGTAVPTPSATSVPLPPTTEAPTLPALPILPSPVLARIDFQDTNEGWGIAVNGSGYVVRTVDGGRTWWNATPAGKITLGSSAILSVLNASTTWVLVPAGFFSGELYRTVDGGQTWKSDPVPFGGGFLQFLDASTGRILAERGARAGSEAVELLQTSDGGANWVSVFHNDPTQSGSSDSLPLTGIKNGMTWRDANTGWVTGFSSQPGNAYLYLTRDGGVSWSQQALPLPAGFSDYQYMPQPPVFFGQDGFLPLLVSLTDRVELTFYSTHDGGLTWSGDPAGRSSKPGLSAFTDPLHGWVWDGGADLYRTTDGAQTWSAVHVSPDLSGNLSQLQFVPGLQGAFTGWALSRVDEAGKSRLYRTSDGSTWTPLNP